VWPRIAPKTPKPEMTRAIIKTVFVMEWTTKVML